MRELTKEQQESRQTFLNILTLYLAVSKKVVASGDLFKAVNEAGEWVFSFEEFCFAIVFLCQNKAIVAERGMVTALPFGTQFLDEIGKTLAQGEIQKALGGSSTELTSITEILEALELIKPTRTLENK